jgi:hypothetical protein
MTLGSKTISGIFLIVVLLGGYYLLTMPDNRTASQKLGDAIHDIDKGPDKAAQQLEDRTPGQKIGDKIKDATSADHQQ